MKNGRQSADHHLPRKRWVRAVISDRLMLDRVAAAINELGLGVRAAGSPGWLTEPHSRRGTGSDLVLYGWQDWIATCPLTRRNEGYARRVRVVVVARTPNEYDWVFALRTGAFDLIEEPHTLATRAEFQRVVHLALDRKREEAKNGTRRQERTRSSMAA